MSVRMVNCGFCDGKPVEKLEERTPEGDWVSRGWKPLTLTHEEIDEMIRKDPLAPYRWVDAPCPRCGGAGEYEVEYVTAKIF